jgi:hypothetical protein
MADTRGERNCNPGNIDRNATLWQGMASNQSDPRFVVFADPIFGIRALAKVLISYYTKYDLNTVAGIIGRWAPASENDNLAYVNHVCDLLGVDQDAAINVEDPNLLEGLVRAIIAHENGRVIYDDATIIKAVDSALT